jgi:hypothetical protein
MMADMGWTKHQEEIEVAELGKAYGELQSDLAAAQERLAEMAEVVRFVREEWFERHYPSDIFTGVSGDEGVLDVIEIKKRLDAVLSAAPTHSRVTELEEQLAEMGMLVAQCSTWLYDWADKRGTPLELPAQDLAERLATKLREIASSAPDLVVLWRGDARWDTETHPERKPILWFLFENGIDIGRTPPPLTDEDGKSVIVTVKEAPSDAGVD